MILVLLSPQETLRKTTARPKEICSKNFSEKLELHNHSMIWHMILVQMETIRKHGLMKIYLYSKASASAMKLLASLILRGRVPLTTVQAVQPNTESIAEAVDDAWR